MPLPFVHMEAPIYLKGHARKGPTFREAVLMHAVARLALHPHIQNIQASWVKMGPAGVAACLDAGVNDLGGTLMNESITRAAGAAWGQELPPEEMEALIRSRGPRAAPAFDHLRLGAAGADRDLVRRNAALRDRQHAGAQVRAGAAARAGAAGTGGVRHGRSVVLRDRARPRARVSRIVWCTVATVDTKGRTRVRILHPMWEGSDRLDLHRPPQRQGEAPGEEPVRVAVLLGPQARAGVRRLSRRVGGRPRREAAHLESLRVTPEPYGYKPAMFWPGGPAGADFGVLKCTPWRIQLGGLTPAGFENRVWRAGRSGRGPLAGLQHLLGDELERLGLTAADQHRADVALLAGLDPAPAADP